MYGKMDENWARGDTLMEVLQVFLVGKTIYSWVVHEIRSGEMIGAGSFYKMQLWSYLMTSSFVFTFFEPQRSFFYQVFLARLYIQIRYFLYLRRVFSKSSKIFQFKRINYLLNGSHKFFLTQDIFFHFNFLRKGFSKILIIFLSDLLLNNFLDCVKMVILKHVVLEILELLITERTSMMAVDCLLDARSAINMAASGDVAISDGIEADSTLEFCFELLWAYLEVDVILLFDQHLDDQLEVKD